MSETMNMKRVVLVLAVVWCRLGGVSCRPCKSCTSSRGTFQQLYNISSDLSKLLAAMNQTRDRLTSIHNDTQTIISGSSETDGGPIHCELDAWSGVPNDRWTIQPSDPLYASITALAASIPTDAPIESRLGYRGFKCNFTLPNAAPGAGRTFARGAQQYGYMEQLLLDSGFRHSAISAAAFELAASAIMPIDCDSVTAGSTTPGPTTTTPGGTSHEPITTPGYYTTTPGGTTTRPATTTGYYTTTPGYYTTTPGYNTTTATSTPTPKPACQDPPYKPANWNDGGVIQNNNNCYNYATNKQTNTFAQPGRASGAIYAAMTGAAMSAAAKKDGLTEFAKQPAAGKFPVTTDCLVALVVHKGDFHWFRQDANGKWSHKPGSTPATNKDNKGAFITDPRLAAIAPYKFVKFMGVCPPNVTVRK